MLKRLVFVLSLIVIIPFLGFGIVIELCIRLLLAILFRPIWWILTNRLIDTIPDKANEFIVNRFVSFIYKTLGIPFWDNDEI